MALSSQMISMIQNTTPETCATDEFLLNLSQAESKDIDVQEYHPPSPIFNPPRDPIDYLPYIPFFYQYIIVCDTLQCIPAYETRYMKFSNKKIFKNQNKYFRKNGYLKQPGGSSCNQRR